MKRLLEKFVLKINSIGWHYALLAIFFLVSIVTLTAWGVLYISSLKEYVKDLLSIGLSGVGVTIAIFIAIKQKIQLKKIENISENLDGQQHLRDKAPSFFRLDQAIEGFNCYSPSEQSRSPLPNIKAGDYYALHKINIVMDTKLFDLIWVENDIGWEDKISRDSIFIGSPVANYALKSIKLEDEGLPFWFQKYADNGFHLKGFDGREIRSPADRLYKKHQDNQASSQNCDIEASVQDYAVVARLEINSKIHIIIAGIHQYGTWIAAEFVDRVLQGRHIDNTLESLSELTENNMSPQTILQNRMMMKNDFLAVVTGIFDSSNLIVTQVAIQEFYQRCNNNKWLNVITGHYQIDEKPGTTASISEV